MTMTSMRPAEKVVAAHPVPQQYMVGGDRIAADWRNGNGDPCWYMSSKENGVQWDEDGRLNEIGRQLLLQHFGLQVIASHLPLEKIATMSPATLLKKRRRLEANGDGLERLEPESGRPGGHISASLAA